MNVFHQSRNWQSPWLTFNLQITLHAFVPHGHGGGRCVTGARRVFAITLPRERLSEILNETPKPAGSGLSLDTISKPFKKYILDLIESKKCWLFSLEDRKRDPNAEFAP